MRWDNLFDDFESQLEAEIGAAERTVHDDEERLRQAHLTVHERLRNLTPPALKSRERAVSGRAEPLRLTLISGGELSVALIRHGRDWCAMDVISPASLAGHSIVPIAAIAKMTPSREQLRASLGARTELDAVSEPQGPRPPRLADTIGLGFVLRDLARRRRMVEVHFIGGIAVGTLDRVGADHCELAEHLPEDARRDKNVTRHVILALTGIMLVRIL